MAKPRDVRLARRAEKGLAALDQRVRDAPKEAIRELARHPLAGKTLKGELAGLWSHRVGPFRIVYRVTDVSLDLVDVDHRKDVYR